MLSIFFGADICTLAHVVCRYVMYTMSKNERLHICKRMSGEGTFIYFCVQGVKFVALLIENKD